jgi:glycosyltransferase involved in cell wall biosynthesis
MSANLTTKTAPLRVLSISLARRGGFPIYGLEMTKALAEICDVSILVASGSDNIDEWRKLPCRAMEVSTYHSNFSGLLSFFNIPKFLSIKRYISSCKPDIVYYPGGHYWKPVIDCLIPSLTPVVITVHDPVTHPGETSLIAKTIALIEYRKPDAYILLNGSQENDFIRANNLSPDKVTIIPHGIFSSYKNSLSVLDNFPDFRSLAEERGKYFLFIGRIVKYKGIETLLKAFRRVLGQINGVLVIAGSGGFSEAEKAEMAHIPDNRIKVFNRWLNDSEIATLTANAYMTVLPYEGATQSGIIPMSAAFGTPSIASDSGGLREQIVDGKTGFIFRAGNVEELASNLVNSTNLTEEEYLKMRRETASYANENWDWNILAEKLAAFLKKTSYLQ